MTTTRRTSLINRRRLQHLGQAVFIAALLAGRTWPHIAPYAIAVFLAGAALTIATIRPADRRKS